jgi:uncharacterized phage-associated protein
MLAIAAKLRWTLHHVAIRVQLLLSQRCSLPGGATIMTQIRFRFDREKMIAILALFASRVPDLDAMKSAKLFYFLDKRHLLRYGRPITGDAYFGMSHGPVPEQAYDIIKAALTKEHRDRTYPRFVAKSAPDMDVLSESDVEVIEEVLKEYGHLSAWKLRDLTHQEPEVKESDEELKKTHRRSVPIPLVRFFDPERDKSIRASVEATQSDRDSATLV